MIIRFKIEVEYIGTNYIGWQSQKSINLPSIQSEIEKAIFSSIGYKAFLICAGRTDSGVHAICQVAHFDIEDGFDKITDFKFLHALNYHLRPNQISILSLQRVSPDWNARFDAVQKTYLYRIINRDTPSVIEKMRAWQIYKKLDLDYLKEASKYLIGFHDFERFKSVHSQSTKYDRTIDDITCIQLNNEIIHIEFYAKSFLHNQVRMMAGTLIEMFRTGTAPSYIKRILAKENGAYSLLTAPPYGLYLKSVKY